VRLILWGVAASAWGALACSTFETHTPSDASSDQTTAQDVGKTSRDAPGAESFVSHDGGTDAGGKDASSSQDADSGVPPMPDAAPPVDTQCDFPWYTSDCAGRTTTSVGSIQMSDDPRIAIALSGSGRIAICYADDSNDDFLTRYVRAVTFMPTMLEQAVPTTLFTGTTDETGGCALAGSSGDTFHVLVNNTENSTVGYGDLTLTSGTPLYETLGPTTQDGYLTLGLLTLDSSRVMAAVGNATFGTIESYVGTTFDGGAHFGAATTAESGIGLNVVGAGQFSLRLGPGGKPMMLVDMEPADAATTSRADLVSFNGSAWGVTTIAGANLASVIGYSPSLAVADGGVRAVYYERGLGPPEAGVSQLEVTTVAGGAVSDAATPIDAAPDSSPYFPLVGAAAAVGPDGRLHIAFIASTSLGKVTLYEARPETNVPGSPIIIDTVDDRLSVEDPPSVNMLIEPSGRIDIAYVQLASGQGYFATRAY
jgi:hypothetical protein